MKMQIIIEVDTDPPAGVDPLILTSKFEVSGDVELSQAKALTVAIGDGLKPLVEAMSGRVLDPAKEQEMAVGGLH